MSIFKLHEAIVDDYSNYIQSFFSIADERIQKFVEESLIKRQELWPDVLIQLNPSYKYADTVEQMVLSGKLNKLCGDVFRNRNGASIRLFRHQKEAIEKALSHKHFIITSGTGSGKTLTYLIPIFHRVASEPMDVPRVKALIIYPMNALVNSQYEALRTFSEQYKKRMGIECPVKFEKYTGQEDLDQKLRIQKNPPHILLTNYVMAELMLVRPEEHNLVDKATSALEFLVVDEVHTYRGRQGADVGLLIRRLRERCGNPNLLCIGTSATMVAGKATSKIERQKAVSQFAEKLFGVKVEPDNVVEETLDRATSSSVRPTPDNLKKAIEDKLPSNRDEFINNPLSVWIEETYGIDVEPDGNLRRKTPISFKEGAKKLSELTGLAETICENRLQDFFMLGIRLSTEEGFPIFAFKLHQFFGQGRTVYSTLEPPSKRVLSLEGLYYAPSQESNTVLFPLQFCRICGQEYYAVLKNDSQSIFVPFESAQEISPDEETTAGYLMLAEDDQLKEWDSEHLPYEWFDRNNRIKRDYRKHIPQLYYVLPDGSFSLDPLPDAIPFWFQPKPFLLCLNCGEFYTRRDKSEYKKLVGLSTEGRSTSTTVLSISALENAPKGGIDEGGRKILSFTDNRQDASLQAGHFNDFILVSLLRAGILAALKKYKRLQFDTIANQVVECLGLELSDVAKNKNLRLDSPQGKEVWKTFQNLIEYRIYEDLRRGWRVVQPNLEQCGLLCIEYRGLDELCQEDANWSEVKPLKLLQPEKRKEILTTVLDHFRRKLAIFVPCLSETYQLQLKKRVEQQINERWGFDETEKLKRGTRFILPGYERIYDDDLSLSDKTVLGRYLKKSIAINGDYSAFIHDLMNVLSSFGLIKKERDNHIEYVQLDASSIFWCECDRDSCPPDPIYSGRVKHPHYEEAAKKANQYFREFYLKGALSLKRIEGQPHTAQVKYEDRQKREQRFKDGDLSCLFCSPTMELGIDIADLQLLHLRNVPPTPANYAQRSGRAGRRGDPALIMTYCSAGSGHDQYFFRHREDMVAGVVRPPRIDLSNEDLVRAHIHAIWLAKISLNLTDSISTLLELSLNGYPIKEDIKNQIKLSESRLNECLAEAESIIRSSSIEESNTDWYSRDWLKNVLIRAPEEFDAALNRWRELYRAADLQWEEANDKLRYPIRDKDERKKAEAQRREAEHQKNLLCNIETTREESDFYPYRYLASEGFLPGYNFPRLPVRAYIPREDGEFISRPRFLAISEFGPRNIIYHEGGKYEAGRLIIPPGGLDSRCKMAKLCTNCGYFQANESADLCENCGCLLDASTSRIVNLLEMPNVKTWKRERISCDEEERRRLGYELTSHFRFSPGPTGQKRTDEASVQDGSSSPLLHLIYGPAAELFRINHGWRNRREAGFLINLKTGEWVSRVEEDEPELTMPPDQIRRICLFVRDFHNILLIYLHPEIGQQEEAFRATLQYCLQRGIEQVFQVEESEIASERIGSGENRAILLYEASEGGVGVLRHLISERDLIAEIAAVALERCHFNLDNFEDNKPECSHACYECLLSYTNQRDYPLLNRHLVKDFLLRLSKSSTQPIKGGRDYEQHYRWLKSLTDSRSELERRFIDHLYASNRRLPDDAQKALKDYTCIPDFFYDPNCCIFCDGNIHDQPAQKERDIEIRAALKDLGYRVVVIRYDQDIEEQVRKYPDIFGGGKETR